MPQELYLIKRSLRYIGESSHEPHDKLSTGLGTSSMKTHLAVIRKNQNRELAIENFEAVLLDLSHVNESSYEKMGTYTNRWSSRKRCTVEV